MNTAHCTTIRLPIGWFTLGPSFCANTAFAGDPAQVYINAWSAVQNVVTRCYAHGIGVLLDMHALPGGANDQIHSGTSRGVAGLWNNTPNLNLATQCLVFLAKQIHAGIPGVIGIQFCNEVETNAPGMYAWYDSVINAISGIDNTIPLYVSDAWDLPTCIKYALSKNRLMSSGPTSTNPIVIDTHKYYCFAASDKAQSPSQIIARIPNELNELNGNDGSVFGDNGAVVTFVGEYSDVLDTQTWSQVSISDRPGLTNQFGQVQSTRWQARSSGCTYWTLKMDWMDGGDWGFKQQVNTGAITAPAAFLISTTNVRSKISIAETQRGHLKDAAVAQHQAYWDKTTPGATFEHWRYGDGYDIGFNDARAFFGARASGVLPGGVIGGDKIGAMDLWVKKRMVDGGQVGAKFGWEWEQGFRQGISDYYSAVGV